MKCKKCGKDYPSRYYFVTESICQNCFKHLDDGEKNRLLDERESLQPEKAGERVIQGRPLICPVCAHQKFWKRNTLMNTPGMTFWGLDWANKQAINYVCDSCGYVMWFLRED